jgi:pimeloyl-ACP methyl ester carboxylesterase
MASSQTKPSIVFAHGIWADGSSSGKLIPTLQAEGHEVLAAQHGLDSVKGDVETVRRALGRVKGPVILVGHSYGGTLITAAGTDERVAGLVYIAALAPDESETSQNQQNKFPVTDVFSHIEVADGRVWMLPDGVACFAGDLPEQEQKVVWATHAAPAADLFNQKIEGTAWRSKPSWYMVARKDRTVQPDLQRFVAERMRAKTYEVDSSHVPMLSKPKTRDGCDPRSGKCHCRVRPPPGGPAPLWRCEVLAQRVRDEELSSTNSAPPSGIGLSARAPSRPERESTCRLTSRLANQMTTGSLQGEVDAKRPSAFN